MWVLYIHCNEYMPSLLRISFRSIKLELFNESVWFGMVFMIEEESRWNLYCHISYITSA